MTENKTHGLCLQATSPVIPFRCTCQSWQRVHGPGCLFFVREKRAAPTPPASRDCTCSAGIVPEGDFENGFAVGDLDPVCPLHGDKSDFWQNEPASRDSSPQLPPWSVRKPCRCITCGTPDAVVPFEVMVVHICRACNEKTFSAANGPQPEPVKMFEKPTSGGTASVPGGSGILCANCNHPMDRHDRLLVYGVDKFRCSECGCGEPKRRDAAPAAATAEKPKVTKVEEQERVLAEAGELISSCMQERDVNNTRLAELLGKTKPWITAMLDGNNFTLKTLSDVLYVLGYKLLISIKELQAPAAEQPQPTPAVQQDAKGEYRGFVGALADAVGATKLTGSTDQMVSVIMGDLKQQDATKTTGVLTAEEAEVAMRVGMDAAKAHIAEIDTLKARVAAMTTARNDYLSQLQLANSVRNNIDADNKRLKKERDALDTLYAQANLMIEDLRKQVFRWESSRTAKIVEAAEKICNYWEKDHLSLMAQALRNAVALPPDAPSEPGAEGKPIVKVVYWWDDHEFSIVDLKEQRIQGQTVCAKLAIDMTTHPARKYVGVENWFAADFVEAHNRTVPDFADNGFEPGQWEHIEEALKRLALAAHPQPSQPEPRGGGR